MKDKIQFDMDAALAGLREGKGLAARWRSRSARLGWR